jgi:hypothetical protein
MDCTRLVSHAANAAASFQVTLATGCCLMSAGMTPRGQWLGGFTDPACTAPQYWSLVTGNRLILNGDSVTRCGVASPSVASPMVNVPPGMETQA